MISEALAFVIAFIVTLIAVKKLIPFLNAIGLTGVDIQKADKRRIPEMGGPMILAGFVLSIFFFIWVRTFLYGMVPNIVPLFAAITTIMIITFIGAFDDLGVLLKRSVDSTFVKRVGLKQWQKPLLTLPAAIQIGRAHV
jgi:UDP-N-acetylmuramyl pentapeptide phosphotransferase/UDP-N-acetylglucosamine-1-phosphate transferase